MPFHGIQALFGCEFVPKLMMPNRVRFLSEDGSSSKLSFFDGRFRMHLRDFDKFVGDSLQIDYHA